MIKSLSALLQWRKILLLKAQVLSWVGAGYCWRSVRCFYSLVYTLAPRPSGDSYEKRARIAKRGWIIPGKATGRLRGAWLQVLFEVFMTKEIKKKDKMKVTLHVDSQQRSHVEGFSSLAPRCLIAECVCVCELLCTCCLTHCLSWRRFAPSDGGGAACTYTLHPSHDSTSELLSTDQNTPQTDRQTDRQIDRQTGR